jgi:5-methylcytosine-specific restriction endonuclease McrA
MRERSKRYLKTEIGRIKSREQKQAAYSKYPDKYRAWSRAEYWERPENGRANSANARARAIGIVEKITGSDILLALREQNYKCLSCDYEIVDYYEVDHQIPLKLGGKNDLLNLQCLCRKCHRAKTTIDLRMAKAANVPVF